MGIGDILLGGGGGPCDRPRVRLYLTMIIFPFALELPSAPRNVTATFLNQSVIGLSWKSPEIIGDRSHVFYDVSCLRPCNNGAQTKCTAEPCQNDVKYIPFNKGLNTTTVLVTNLSPFVNYTFKIYARNRVSEVAKRRHGIEGNFTVITVTTIGTGKSVRKKKNNQPNLENICNDNNNPTTTTNLKKLFPTKKTARFYKSLYM